MYGAAFVMRPLGGLLLGYIGDKYGRTIALQLSVVGMGLAALTLAALPSYDYGAYKAGLAREKEEDWAGAAKKYEKALTINSIHILLEY